MNNDVALSQNESARRVDIIVPVYRAIEETRACLDSVLASSQKTPTTLIVIDDASDEPELADYLSALAEAKRITLWRNERNQGFVATVNRGMRLNPDHDVIILNSDTQVAGDWVDRLARCAYSAATVATVTPFSNNATICSYPRFCSENTLPPGWSTASLDALFREVNAGQALEIPTAVGFCMYIRRDCLAAIGYFDSEGFGAGYGEENDFSMRALKAGWHHLLCADTFVYHVGGVSFGPDRSAQQEKGMTTLLERHPDYTRRVTEFIRRDPPLIFRRAIDWARARVSAEDARQVLNERDQEIEAQYQQHQESLQTLTRLEEGLRHAEQLLSQTRAALAERDAALAEAQGFVRLREREIQVLGNQTATLQIQAVQLQGQINQLQDQINHLQGTLAVIHASRSWRYTRLFRRS